MNKHALIALLPVALAGCGTAPPQEAANPASPTRTASPIATATPIPRIAGQPAPLLASAPVIPEVKLPNPNGYDLLVKAAESIDQKDAGTPLTGDKLSPEEDLKRQRASTKKNAAAAITMARRALAMPMMVPPKRGLLAKSPPYSSFRWMARIFLQEGFVHAADKKPEAAVSSALDAVEMGAKLQSGSNSIGMLVGLAIESLGRGGAMQWRTDLDAAQALAAAKRLQKIEEERPSYATAQQEVMWNNLSEMRDLISGTEKAMRGDKGNPKFAAVFKDKRTPEAIRQMKLQIESNFISTSRALLARAHASYSPELTVVPDPADDFSRMVLEMETSRGPTYSRVNYERNSAAHRMLITEIALQAFDKDHDKYPASLSELAPKYLSAVPRDPFRPGSPLNYKPSLGSYVLYSVGPDGVDDGGSPIKSRGLSVGDKGDMISGVFK